MKLLIIALTAVPLFAFADNDTSHSTITITSFVMNDSSDNSRDTTAEICGTLNDKGKVHNKVIITSDPGDKQGQYLAFVTPNRTFCHVIRTITGNATVETYNHKLTKKPEDSVTAKVK